MAWFCIVGSTLEDTLVVGAASQPALLEEESIDAKTIQRSPGGMALNIASHLAHLDSTSKPYWTHRHLLSCYARADKRISDHLNSLSIVPVQRALETCRETGRCVSISYPPADARLPAPGVSPKATDRCFYVAIPKASILKEEHLTELEPIAASHNKDGPGHIHLANIGGIDAYATQPFVNQLNRLRESGVSISGSTVSYPEGLARLDVTDVDSPGRALLKCLDWPIMSSSEARTFLEEMRGCGDVLPVHPSLDQTLEATRRLFAALALRNLVITCGECGCAVLDGAAPRAGPIPVQPFDAASTNLVDPTGAGDAWAAAFVHSLKTGLTTLDSAKAANRYAALSLSVIGGSSAPKSR